MAEDWKDKLAEEFRSKRQGGDQQGLRKLSEDAVIKGRGREAWNQLMGMVDQACRHISQRENAQLKFMRNSGEGFTVAGGVKALDVTLDEDTMSVSWELRFTSSEGSLRPQRDQDNVVYRDNASGETLSVQKAVTFLVRKVF